jgi:hypothetical protein
MGVICLVALVASSCSWIATTRVPDKWTAREPLTCDTSPVAIISDFVVAPLIGGALYLRAEKIAKEGASASDPHAGYLEASGVLIAILVTPVTWYSGGAGVVAWWRCNKAKKERKAWLQAHPPETDQTPSAAASPSE